MQEYNIWLDYVKNCDSKFCDLLSEIIRHHYVKSLLADVWFYNAGGTCIWCKIVWFWRENQGLQSLLPACDKSKSLTKVLAAPRLALKTYGVELGLVDPVSG